MAKKKPDSELWQLKRWIPLEEASKILSLVFENEVKPKDLLQWGLEGQLTLSIIFANDTAASPCRLIPRSMAKCSVSQLTDDLCAMQIHKSIKYSEIDEAIINNTGNRVGEYLIAPINKEFLHLEKEGEHYYLCASDESLVVSLSDEIYDLPMIAGEQTAVTGLLHEMIKSGLEIESNNIHGSFVTDQNGGYYRLEKRIDDEALDLFGKGDSVSYFHPQNYYPIRGLPDNNVIVVRTSSLTKCIDRIIKASKSGSGDKKIDVREKDSLLLIIAALLKAQGWEPDDRETTGKVEKKMNLLGINMNIKTIRKHLRTIPDVVARKGE